MNVIYIYIYTHIFSPLSLRVCVCAGCSVVSQSLDPAWHCELVPLMHTSSFLRAQSKDADGDGESGEGVTRELERFKSCLVNMFAQQGQGVAFLETAIHGGGGREEGGGGRVSKHHAVIDVIPFEKGMDGEIEMFFRQVSLLALIVLGMTGVEGLCGVSGE